RHDLRCLAEPVQLEQQQQQVLPNSAPPGRLVFQDVDPMGSRW
ncbi:hypothetical protein BN1723_019478, partial [Verticillium longisporum]